MEKNLSVCREDFIDVARGIGIILMLIGHSSAPVDIVKFIYGFHMPFFFILSGYLYDKTKWEQRGIEALIKKRWKAYVIPYFIYSFVNLIINIPVEYSSIRGKELVFSTLKHIFWIFYSYGSATKTPNCTPLWFLLCIFVCSIYFYFLLKLKNTSLQIVACFFMMWMDYLLYTKNIIQLPWHIDVALLGTVFMYIGYIFKNTALLNKTDHEILISLCLLITGTYCIANNNRIDINPNKVGNIVLMTVGATCISLNILIICKKYLNNFHSISFLGKNTIIIMAFNYAINIYSSVIWSYTLGKLEIEFTWWMCSIIDIVVCVFIIFILKTIKRKLTNSSIMIVKE